MIGNNENVIISHEIGFASLVFMKVEHEIYAKEVSMNLILLINTKTAELNGNFRCI